MPDLTTYHWRQIITTANPTANEQYGMVQINGGNAIAFGGDGPSSTYLDETWKFDGTDWSQLSPATTPGGRVRPAMAWNGSYILLFGGVSLAAPATGRPNDYNYLDTWKYDPGSNTWTDITPASSPPRTSNYMSPGSYAMFWDGSRFVMLINKFVATGNWPRETWAFDGTDWSNLSPTHPPGTLHNPNTEHHVAAAGGANAIDYLSTIDNGTTGEGGTWNWDGSDWTVRTNACNPNPFPSSSATGHPDETRGSLPVAYDDDTHFLLFGGAVDDTGFLGRIEVDDTWMLDSSGWSELPQSVHPGKREAFEMVYDPTRLRFMLYGGHREDGGHVTYYQDTWVFEPGGSVAAAQTFLDPVRFRARS